VKSGSEATQLDRKTQIERELSLIAAQEGALVDAVKRTGPVPWSRS
jgi:hypothetical protein